MKPTTIATYAWRSILAGRLRTALTIIAIVVGMASISLLTGIAKGISLDVEETSTSLGKDLIIVIPTTLSNNAFLESRRQNFVTFRETFTESDVGKVKGISGVEKAAGALASVFEVNFSGEQKSINVVGAEKSYEEIVPSIKVAYGRWFSSPKEVVLGSRVAKDTFSKEVRVGDKIYIGGKRFRVSGILEETGNALARVDDRIIIDISSFRGLKGNTFGENEVTAIVVKVAEGYDVEEVGENIRRVLRLIKRVGERDTFTVVTPKFIKNQVSQVLSVLEVFFLAVSSMALLVGLVGISNTIYMNIIDRRREIALLKTLGAKNIEVVRAFITEAFFMASMGGIVGSLLGILLGYIQPFLSFVPDVFLVAGALVSIVFVGSAVAYFPSKHAISISPAEALRYE